MEQNIEETRPLRSLLSSDVQDNCPYYKEYGKRQWSLSLERIIVLEDGGDAEENGG